jgi:hypothetical protein
VTEAILFAFVTFRTCIGWQRRDCAKTSATHSALISAWQR